MVTLNNVLNNVLTWPPTADHFEQYMRSALAQSDKDNVTVLVYCDNPGVMIFDPMENLIRCESQEANARSGNRKVRVIIGKED